MTPAEKLAKTKQRERPRRNKSEKPPGPLVCRCRSWRESMNLSLRDVAAAVDLSVSGLHAIERGNDVQVTTAKRLAAFYGKTIDELWDTK